MSFDLIRTGENGQLYFDFESLEALTSADFVNDLKSTLATNNIVKVQMHIDDEALTLRVITHWCVVKSRFWFTIDHFYNRFFDLEDLEDLGFRLEGGSHEQAASSQNEAEHS